MACATSAGVRVGEVIGYSRSVNSAVSSVFRIGQWRIEPAVDEISRDGTVIKLEPRAMRVLVCLAERAGEVVSVEQLLDAVWKDVVVTQDSVYQAMAGLRRALGDDPKQPGYIVNVVRKGYRLVAPVTPWDPPTPGGFIERRFGLTERHRLQRFALIAVACALAAGGAGSIWLAERAAAPEPASSAVILERSIAVLPFADMSENHDQEYFADGMAEEVLDMLARIPQLKVIGRTSSFQFKGKNEDLRVIGTSLGAAYVVQGSVRKAGARIRVTAQLIDVSSGMQVWAGSYDRGFDDILNVQEEIAASIGRALQLVVVADDTPPRQLRSPEAYTIFLLGRAALDRGDEHGLRESVSHFEHALALDPNFSRAAEMLALSYLGLMGNAVVPVDTAWPKAADAARTALHLDRGSALAHAVLGLQHATYNYDWVAAENELSLALALKPRDSVALYNLSWLAFDLGRHEDAVSLSEASLSIDPLNPDSCQNSAYIYYLIGNLDAAERNVRRSMTISPSFTGNHKLLGQILLLRGEPELALAEMQKEVSSLRDVGLALAFHALGRRADSDASLARAASGAGRLVPVDIAAVHAYRGEKSEAFEWLARAVAAKDLALGHKFRDEPKLAPLRNDPRYQALLRRMNLPLPARQTAN